MKTMNTAQKPLFILCYRQGTPTRYRWQQTLISASDPADLAIHAQDIERMGHKAHIMPATMLASGYVIPKHGLPESYSPTHCACDVLHDVWHGGWLADAKFSASKLA